MEKDILKELEREQEKIDMRLLVLRERKAQLEEQNRRFDYLLAKRGLL